MQSKLIDTIDLDAPTSDWPGLRLAPRWKSLVSELENRKPRGWVEMCARLLSASFDEQRRIAKLLDEVASKTRKAAGARAMRARQTHFGPKRRRQEILIVAFKGYSERKISEYVPTMVGEHRKDWIVIRMTAEGGFHPVVMI